MAKITVKNTQITVISEKESDYISLTDMAGYKDNLEARILVSNRMSTYLILTVWDSMRLKMKATNNGMKSVLTIISLFYLCLTVNAQTADTIPPDGTYRFDIAFAEWEGKSMGEKVKVVIHGDSIRVIHEGDGYWSGEKVIMDNGKIMKHKSGVWIICNDPSDTQLDEVGGCTGGPTVIDFKNKKYEIC